MYIMPISIAKVKSVTHGSRIRGQALGDKVSWVGGKGGKGGLLWGQISPFTKPETY